MKGELTWEVDANGCWNCTSHKPHKSGYPRVKMNNKSVYAHRYVYEQLHGKIPDGLVVRHKCDNRMCINPDHLELGTVADNNRDKKERGRGCFGEKNHFAKLTEDDVLAIRSSNLPLSVLARKYGIDKTNINLVRRGITWSHVGGELKEEGRAMGTAIWSAVLDADKVRQIKEMLRRGEKGVDIARAFGVKPGVITRIKKGQTWKHVS